MAHFCYVDEGAQTTDRFETFLEQYGRLLPPCQDFRVIYIANMPSVFLKAPSRRFEEFSKTTGRQNTPFDPSPGVCWSILKRAESMRRVIFRGSIPLA